jgi:hypothetical protein
MANLLSVLAECAGKPQAATKTTREDQQNGHAEKKKFTPFTSVTRYDPGCAAVLVANGAVRKPAPQLHCGPLAPDVGTIRATFACAQLFRGGKFLRDKAGLDRPFDD